MLTDVLRLTIDSTLFAADGRRFSVTFFDATSSPLFTCFHLQYDAAIRTVAPLLYYTLPPCRYALSCCFSAALPHDICLMFAAATSAALRLRFDAIRSIHVTFATPA